jgi:hypothetical protein
LLCDRVTVDSVARVAALVVLTSCGPPGVVVELYNHTLDELLVRETYNDASETSERLAPNARAEFGPAVSWYIVLPDAIVELEHPGDAFAKPRLLGQQLFRFQIEPPGCLFVLLPEQRPPVAQLPPQPPGYPLGGSVACARQRNG